MNKRSIALLFCILVTPISSYSADSISNNEIAVCAVIEGDLSRLECYDLLATKYKLNGPQPQAVALSGTGKWIVSDELNPVDDSRTVHLALQSENGKSRWGEPIGLIIRCKSNKTELYVNWQDYLGSDVRVLARVGSKKAITKKWSLSTDKQASFYPRGAITFIKELLEADKLVLQVTPYNESPVTAVFEIAGLNSAIAPLRETCSW